MLEDYFIFLRGIIDSIPFNIFDYVMILTLFIYVFEDASFGMIPAALGFLATLLSFFIGLTFYHPLSKILVDRLSLTKGISDAISFFLVTIVAFFVLSRVFFLLRKKYINVEFPKVLNFGGGAFFGFLSFFFISSFAVALLLSFPISKVIKTSVNESITGRFLSNRTQGIEGYVRQIFGGAIAETINFLTVEPESNKSVNLNFKTHSYKEDKEAESKMVDLVNSQRQKVGLGSVLFDSKLNSIALEHAKDMVERGYFSHFTREGLSPFDRMAVSNVYYTYAGENLAFAPDVQIAMDGLMKSPGHRANILSKNFNKIGVGIIDVGIYGEMFVQEFTD